MASKKNKRVQRKTAKEVLAAMKPNTYKVRVSSSTPNFAGFIAPLPEINNILSVQEILYFNEKMLRWEGVFAPFMERLSKVNVKNPTFTIVNVTTGLDSDSFPATTDNMKLARAFWKALLQAQWPADANPAEMAQVSSCKYITTIWNRRVNGRSGEIHSTAVDFFDFKEVKKEENKVKRVLSAASQSKIAPTQLGQLYTKVVLIEQVAAALKAPEKQQETALLAPAPKKRSPRKSAKAVVDAAEVAAKNVVVVEATAEVI